MITLILLPGLDGSGEFFEALRGELPNQWPTQVVKYPGNQPLSYRELAQHVLAAWPRTGSVVLVAESFSGPVAIEVAASRPQGLLGVILCATFARNPYPVLSPLHRLAGVAPVRLAPSNLLARVLLGRDTNAIWADRIHGAIAQCSDFVLRARLREVLLVDVRNLLAVIQVPVLYLQASYDPVVPASSLKEMQQVLPSMEAVRIDGPHFLLQARSKPCAEQIASFVERLRKST